jgi:predicted nucleotidyltransferase
MMRMGKPLVVPVTGSLSLDQAIQRVTTHHEVESVVLLGSTATGHLNVASDYDIMVVVGDIDGLTVEVTAVDGRLTDVLVVSLATLRRAQRGDDDLSCRIASWLERGLVVFDRSGDVRSAQHKIREGGSPAPSQVDDGVERMQISYDLLVNENCALSSEPRYRLALRLRSLHSFSRLLLAYFRVRRVVWQGEKWAIQYLEQHDPEFLAVVVEWLDAPDPTRQLVLHRQAAEAVLAPLGGVWPAGTFPLGTGIWERLTGDAP